MQTTNEDRCLACKCTYATGCQAERRTAAAATAAPPPTRRRKPHIAEGWRFRRSEIMQLTKERRANGR